MRLVSLAALLCVGLSTGCHAPSWTESKPDGKFKILTPTPLVEENPKDKKANETIYGVTEKHGRYMVYISEVVSITDVPIIQESLRAIANEIVEKSDAKMRYVRPFVLAEKYQAIDFEADRMIHKMAIRVWVIYAHNRVYRLIVSGDRSWMTMAQINKFLQSFEVLE